MVSVIMSIYNEEEKWLKEAIDSVLNQTYSNFELIIINDNPSRQINDKIVSEYINKDKRISYHVNNKNIGLTKSLNIGFRYAKGKYIARMDADDICYPNRFEKQYHFLEQHKDIIAVGSWFEYFGKINKKNTEYRCAPNEVQNFLMIYTPIAHPTVMIRKAELDRHQIKYNEDFRFAQDYDFFYQLSKVGKLANIPEVLLKYRTTEKQISSKNINQQQQFAISIRKKVISELITNEFYSEFDVSNIKSLIDSFIKVQSKSRLIKKQSNNYYQRLAVLKYVLLISSKKWTTRLSFLVFLLFNPFQKIGFSNRFYFKALSHQLFLNYKPLL